jgi:TolB-like protein
LIRDRDRVVSRDDLIGAIWGGRIISESALTTRINAVRHAIGDSGAEQRLIKTLPRKGFRFVGSVQEEEAPTRPVMAGISAGPLAPPLSLPDRPSIAVLPFANMSGDVDQDYFADGLTEDLITSLARIRWLFVIARNSSFVYKDRAANVKQVSRELGVRYVLEGSVRRGANRLRVSVQLVDALTGAHHWAERYDRALGDILAIQDEITRSVAAAIEPQLLAAEGIRTLSHSPDNLGAWELVPGITDH